MTKDKKHIKKNEGRGKVSAAKSNAQREEEIAKGIEDFAKSRENEDLFLV